jgi:hypothetical protein
MATRTPGAFETWQVALPRRVMTLARMEPIHRFEATKATRGIELASHDLRTLALMVFDAVIERMGLAAGASQDEIVEALAPLICAAEPEADAARVRIVEQGKHVIREVVFHYIEQLLGPNDEPLFRATVEGINLYTGSLGLDVEDAHAANAAVLKYQIGRGRFREAVATARQAVAISTGYAQKVRRAIEIARRDVAQLDWAREILATLSNAREHLRGRIDADNEIFAAVEEHQEDAEIHERMHVAELIRHIRECQTRHAELHRVIIDANDTWLGEHARQAFRPRAIRILPDLEGAVLHQALLLDDRRLNADRAWQVARVFLPATAPVLADGRALVELLLAPIRENEMIDPSAFDPDAEEMPEALERFSEQDFRDVDILIESLDANGSLVSELINAAKEEGKTETVQTLLYLVALQEYGEVQEGAARVVENAGHGFIVDPFWGDDLHIRPLAERVEDLS